MGDIKRVTVFGPGRTASTQIDIAPGDTVKQLISLLLPEFHLDSSGVYQLAGPDKRILQGDIHKAVKDGDTLDLIHEEVGGC